MTNYDTTLQILKSYSEVELRFRKHYESTGAYLPLTTTPEKHDTIMLSEQEIKIAGQIRTNNMLELSEDVLFRNSESISLSKHNRYTQPIEHFHSFFELIYVMSGKCTNYIDGKEMFMLTGALCIVPPNVPHSICVNDDSIILNISVRISTFNKAFTEMLRLDDVLSKFFGEIIYSRRYRKYLLFHTANDDTLRFLTLAMYHHYMMKPDYYDRIIRGYLDVFFSTLLSSYENLVEYPQGYIEKDGKVSKIVSHITKNCENITLEKCAEHFHFNARYLSGIIKKETGKRFPEIVTAARIERAKTLIEQYDVPLQDLAQLLGYNDASYFMKVFKKQTGCTPTDYKAACRFSNCKHD
jgi:AraC-like DNA-binding protein/mannose-6-phosphate isomerase-like protein (cupin superfamily)